MMKNITPLLIATLFLTSSPVLAEEMLDLIAVRRADVSLTHNHMMEPDQFGIVIKTPHAASGCYEISGLDYSTSFIEGNFMDIKVNGFRREPMKGVNPSYECNKGNKVVSGMVVTSAEDLRTRGIRQVRISNGNVEDTYDVILSENSVELKPDRVFVFRPTSKTLSYNFSGKGIVALHVPMAQNGDDLEQAVRNFAYKRALTTDAQDEDPNDNVFFFMDQNGSTLDKLGDQNFVELGTITVSRPYDGPEGRQAIAVPLKVFATRPETTL